MARRVFVSFDFDNDKKLKDFIIGQSKLPDSPFEVSDWSGRSHQGLGSARLANGQYPITRGSLQPRATSLGALGGGELEAGQATSQHSVANPPGVSR